LTTASQVSVFWGSCFIWCSLRSFAAKTVPAAPPVAGPWGDSRR
jgi:hypothetical protein